MLLRVTYRDVSSGIQYTRQYYAAGKLEAVALDLSFVIKIATHALCIDISNKNLCMLDELKLPVPVP